MTSLKFKVLIIAAAAAFVLVTCNSANRPIPTELAIGDMYLAQDVNIPKLPAKLDFAGEPVPMDNFDVRESIEREMMVISYWHSSMLYTIRLTARYFPLIEPILKEQGVPDDFKYLCIAESNLQQVVSPAKAAGLWQFLEATGKQYNLEVNKEIDERYHVEKSTVAACAYLKEAYAQYGSWTLAAASYNVGRAHVSMQIKRQKTNSYYDMLLNEETARYVYRALVFKTILTDPAKFGFKVAKEDMFPPLKYTEEKVSKPVANLVDFAIERGTNYKILKYFNPWLRDTVLTNKANKTYTIKVPVKNYRTEAYTYNE